jgi:hypothetical protein
MRWNRLLCDAGNGSELQVQFHHSSLLPTRHRLQACRPQALHHQKQRPQHGRLAPQHKLIHGQLETRGSPNCAMPPRPRFHFLSLSGTLITKMKLWSGVLAKAISRA